MGMIYKRKYKRKDGTIAEAAVWWIKYYRDGVPMRESTESDKESVAKNLLKQREGDISRGVPITPQTNRATFDDLADDVLNDYKVNQRRTIKDATRRLQDLREVFGDRKAAGITVADVRQYAAKRLADGLSNASVNHELKLLSKAFRMGMEAGKVTVRPKITKLKEHNIRKGFFEREQFESLRSKMPTIYRPLLTFLYVTGWRVSEVFGLQWRQVDFEAGTVRLEPGETKNEDARVFVMTTDLRQALEAQRAYRDKVQKERGCIVPSVFHRDGTQIKGIRKAWDTACKKAGLADRLRHDFRRTAVRNMVRAGIPERVAMTMTGHKTRSIFERYNITSEGDLLDAARKLDAFAGTVAGTVRNGLAGTVAAK
jgi:integrase